MSGVSGEGVQDVLRALWKIIVTARKEATQEDDQPWQP
jgi:hypothetical protein